MDSVNNDSFSTNVFVVTLHAQCKRGKVIGVGVHIRECSSTLYVGLARAVPPTNTNFRLTYLLSRLQQALYETYLYRASNLKCTITLLAFVS